MRGLWRARESHIEANLIRTFARASNYIAFRTLNPTLRTLVKTVADHAAATPDKPALIAGGKALSYGDLWRRIAAAGEYLHGLGVRSGDRVVLSARASSPSFVCGYLATHLIGGVAVLVDPQTPATRLAYIRRRVEPHSIFLVKGAGEASPAPRSIEELEHPDFGARTEFSGPSLDAAADILFTSGTTGDPKGVVLTHRNICSAALNINTFIRNGAEDREVVPLPLSHSFGLGRLRYNLFANGTVILVNGLAFPGQICLAIERWGATGLSSVPAGFGLLLHLSNDRLSRYADQLRYIEIGSAPMPIEHKRALMRLLPNTRICMHYGLTEASRAAFIEFHESAGSLDSIGRAAPNVEIRIVGNDPDTELPPLEHGRIVVRGDMVMSRYWKDPERQNEMLRGAWLFTGDFGYRDAEGYLYLVAREKELINVGGRKVAPSEIENALLMHEAIYECACVGTPDPRQITGEVVTAFVVPRDGSPAVPSAKALRDFLRDYLEPYKIPAAFYWVDAIPKTLSGKVQRALLATDGTRQG